MRLSWIQSRWFLTASTTSLILLAVSFHFAPAALLRGSFAEFSDPSALGNQAGAGLVKFWRSGTSAFPTGLSRLVDYWFWWHAIKTVICLLFIATAVLLCAGIWRRYLTVSRRGSAVVCAIGASVVSLFTFGAAIALLANIQSALVPFVAVLQLIDDPDSATGLRKTLQQIHTNVAAGTDGPVLKVLVGQVQFYEWTIALASVIAAVLLTSLASVFWKRRHRLDPSLSRHRSMHRMLAATTAIMALAFLALATVSLIEAVDARAAVVDVLGGPIT